MIRPSHNPIGNPCKVCGIAPILHRVTHPANGEPCIICHLPRLCHRIPEQVIEAGPIKHEQDFEWGTAEPVYLGIDGEGQGKKDHKYIFLACADISGRFRVSAENRNGLKTEECLDFMLGLPQKQAKVFAYSFGYDLTKILTDCDNDVLYRLFRPELRQRTGDEAVKGPNSETWRGYKLNYQGAKFTVKCGKRKTIIWDVFKFFQGRFVAALKDWKVGDDDKTNTTKYINVSTSIICDKCGNSGLILHLRHRSGDSHFCLDCAIRALPLLERMQLMKDQRGFFDKLPFDKVKDYCFEECMCMAELAKRLTDAHSKVGLQLKTYYGAGSSAAAMLNVMGIREKLSKNYPEEMKHAISASFFGGRFENSVIGKIEEPVYVYDISSAYPYQLVFLPCLLHGKWSRTRNRRLLEHSRIRTAFVKYGLKSHSKTEAWGPFPFRDDDGSICFPSASGGGWVGREEYLQGERLFDYVYFKEAWVYECDCNCVPFEKIPSYYLERLRIGKEGPGIVIKLGCNSCYGKLAQSVGSAIFNSWIWASLITSGTRAQLLELLGCHQNRRNALMTATDGLATREKLDTPKPLETGTAIRVVDESTGKEKYAPLGGWEEKTFKQGMFFARPGVYFPLNPTKEDIKDVRGRGVGKGVILENWQRIIDRWPVVDLVDDTVSVANVNRFCGAKSSISRAGVLGKYKYTRAQGTRGKPAYGQWISRGVDMSFNPLPKRGGVSKADGMSLLVRRMAPGIESQPYDRCPSSDDHRMLIMAEAELLEQPDGDIEELY